MTTIDNSDKLRFALPKGRIQKNVLDLLADAGLGIQNSVRNYRPKFLGRDFDTKILKPQNIVEMLAQGSRDLGFAGADWVAELSADLVEILDTKLDPVRIVAAAPPELFDAGKIPQQRLSIATEYCQLTQTWLDASRLNAEVIRSFGATEVFPPEDADMIVDNTSTGATLTANGLVIADVVFESTTRLYASQQAMRDAAKRQTIEEFKLLMQSVLAARERVTIEINVESQFLEGLISVLPCMREPTISKLYGDAGYSVKVAVKKLLLPSLIPQISASGGTDVVVIQPTQIVA